MLFDNTVAMVINVIANTDNSSVYCAMQGGADVHDTLFFDTATHF